MLIPMLEVVDQLLARVTADMVEQARRESKDGIGLSRGDGR